MRVYASIFLLGLVFFGTPIKLRGIVHRSFKRHAEASLQQALLVENDPDNSNETSPHRGGGR